MMIYAHYFTIYFLKFMLLFCGLGIFKTHGGSLKDVDVMIIA